MFHNFMFNTSQVNFNGECVTACLSTSYDIVCLILVYLSSKLSYNINIVYLTACLSS